MSHYCINCMSKKAWQIVSQNPELECYLRVQLHRLINDGDKLIQLSKRTTVQIKPNK